MSSPEWIMRNSAILSAQTSKSGTGAQQNKDAAMHCIASAPATQTGLRDPHRYDSRAMRIEDTTVTLPAAAAAAIGIILTKIQRSL